MASVFKRGGKGPWIVNYFDADGRRHEKSTRTTDHKVARRIAADLDAKAALRREGLIDPQQDRFAEANRRPLSEHFQEYAAHMEHLGRTARHTKQVTQTLQKMGSDISASRLADLTLNAVEHHLSRLREAGKSARTVNYARSAVVAFVNWCEQTSRVERNALKHLERLNEQCDRRRERRPLTDGETARLLKVAGPRRLVYETAVGTGLRRSELASLAWGDLDLEADPPTLTVRASASKSRREAVVPLHSALAASLLAERPELVLPQARVFKTMPTNARRRLDFEAAEIPSVDDAGRQVDFHSLRGTFASRLARAGVPSLIARDLMRHASVQTTEKHYVRLQVMDLAGAVQSIQGHSESHSAAATGTNGRPDPLVAAAASCGPVSRPPPHQPQQSQHGTTRGGATECDTTGGTRAEAGRRNVPSSAGLGGDKRRGATRRNGSPGQTRTDDPLINSQML